jgi:hypothetical protein
VRIDSTDGNIYAHYPSTCPPNHIVLWDSLNSQLNNSFVACVNFPTPYRTCEQIGSMTLFSFVRPFKSFSALSSWQARRKYVSGFGIAYLFIGELHPEIYTLIGCVINGVVYGDTSLVGINQISSEIPEIYSLSQNYPNPFNPTTIIRFAIPSYVKSEMSNVKIFIYDVLGREVQTLVNENVSPGTYEVDFDGSNLPSGVYYYKLEVSDHSNPLRVTETKKMVLIK